MGGAGERRGRGVEQNGWGHGWSRRAGSGVEQERGGVVGGVVAARPVS